MIEDKKFVILIEQLRIIALTVKDEKLKKSLLEIHEKMKSESEDIFSIMYCFVVQQHQYIKFVTEINSLLNAINEGISNGLLKNGNPRVQLIKIRSKINNFAENYINKN